MENLQSCPGHFKEHSEIKGQSSAPASPLWRKEFSLVHGPSIKVSLAWKLSDPVLPELNAFLTAYWVSSLKSQSISLSMEPS